MNVRGLCCFLTVCSHSLHRPLLVQAVGTSAGDGILAVEVLPGGQTLNVESARAQPAQKSSMLELSEVSSVSPSSEFASNTLVRKQAPPSSGTWLDAAGKSFAVALTRVHVWSSPATSRRDLVRPSTFIDRVANASVLAVASPNEDPADSDSAHRASAQSLLLLLTFFLSIFAVTVALAALCLAAKDLLEPPIVFESHGTLGARLQPYARRGGSVGSGNVSVMAPSPPQWSSMTSYKLDPDPSRTSGKAGSDWKKVDGDVPGSSSDGGPT